MRISLMLRVQYKLDDVTEIHGAIKQLYDALCYHGPLAVGPKFTTKLEDTSKELVKYKKFIRALTKGLKNVERRWPE